MDKETVKSLVNFVETKHPSIKAGLDGRAFYSVAVPVAEAEPVATFYAELRKVYGDNFVLVTIKEWLATVAV